MGHTQTGLLFDEHPRRFHMRVASPPLPLSQGQQVFPQK